MKYLVEWIIQDNHHDDLVEKTVIFAKEALPQLPHGYAKCTSLIQKISDYLAENKLFQSKKNSSDK